MCPAQYTCLDYEGAVLQIDPQDGPYQVFIVAEVKTTTTTATDDRTERSVVAAGFAQEDDGSFAFDREYQRPKEGVFQDAQLGDLLKLGE